MPEVSVFDLTRIGDQEAAWALYDLFDSVMPGISLFAKVGLGRDHPIWLDQVIRLGDDQGLYVGRPK